MYIYIRKKLNKTDVKQSCTENIGYTLPERREQVFVRVCCSGSSLALTRQTSAVPAARSRDCRLRGTSSAALQTRSYLHFWSRFSLPVHSPSFLQESYSYLDKTEHHLLYEKTDRSILYIKMVIYVYIWRLHEKRQVHTLYGDKYVNIWPSNQYVPILKPQTWTQRWSRFAVPLLL